ncbi:OmpA family protein [Bradyrhizobium sp.]|uniref:OmpA family protein n=1 Tax=Bradyrhizobium sp. TaxID=376 RepID=UPI003C7479F7
MSESQHWWIGILPLLVIWAIASFVMTDRVESDLAARATAAVIAAPILNAASVTVAGRDARLAGTAFDAQGKGDTVKLALDTDGVRLVNDDITTVPSAQPYAFNARRDGDRLVLSGNVPRPAARAKILEAARSSAPGATVVDQLSYAQGAPDGFETIAAYGLTEAGKLAGGEVSLSNNAYSIAGRASTAAIYRAALAATRQLPAGATIARVDIKSDEITPYIFNATKSGGAIRLSGYYPDEKTHRELLSAIGRRFLGARLSDELTQGKGAPKDFAKAASAMLQQLSRLSSGAGSMSDLDITVKGDAFYAKAAADIPSALSAAVPRGYNANATIGVAAPGEPIVAAACQPLFADILAQGKILFEISQASIQNDSDAVLDNLAATAMRCPDAHIEISGHTDSVGRDDSNLELSRRRAEAVSHYLIKAGIAPERLTAIGYGKTRPIASNDTEEGRAQNRRIEFDAK